MGRNNRQKRKEARFEARAHLHDSYFKKKQLEHDEEMKRVLAKNDSLKKLSDKEKIKKSAMIINKELAVEPDVRWQRVQSQYLLKDSFLLLNFT